MKIQSKILLTLKRNYRNTSMSSQTSKVFSDFKKWPRNLSKITSSEKSPKSQRSSPQQICQGECFAPYVKQNFQMHRYEKIKCFESTEFPKFANIKVRSAQPRTLDIQDENLEHSWSYCDQEVGVRSTLSTLLNQNDAVTPGSKGVPTEHIGIS